MGVSLHKDGLTGNSNIVQYDGLKEFNVRFYTINNQTQTWDIPVGNEGGAGQVIHVTAMYDHYYNFAYGCGHIGSIGKRQQSLNYKTDRTWTSGNGGSFSFSTPDNSTLRITRNAGSYVGGGYGFIRVLWGM